MISSSDPRDGGKPQCTFIDACKKAGIKHVVKFSGAESGISFDPGKFPFRAHARRNRTIPQRSGARVDALAPKPVHAGVLREAPTIVAENVLYLPMDNARLSPVDIEDIARVAFAVLHNEGHEGKSYDMTGPEHDHDRDSRACFSGARKDRPLCPMSLQRKKGALC